MAIVADNAKLVLNAFAAIFQNNMTVSDAVTWKQYNGEMEDRNRITVVEQVGPRFAVTQTTNGVVDLSSGVQDVVLGSEQFQVNQVFGTNLGWGDFAAIRDINEARQNVALKNAAINLAEKIDAYILRTACYASNNWTGTPGNAVGSYDSVLNGYTRLKEEGVDDADLRAILTYGDKQALGSSIVSNNASLTNMGDGIYRKGFDGEVGGIPTMFTQQLPTLTTGTRTNGTMNGANQNVNYSAVSVSSAPGFYLSQTISVNGLGANATVTDGEVFTIAGVNAWDNRLGAARTNLQQFRVIGPAGTQPGTTAAYTADGSGAIAAMRIFPAIIVPNTGTGGDINVNTANATCSAVPGASAVITWAVAASTAVKPRLMIQKESIIVNTVDLITPYTGTIMRKSLTKMPLSVRMWQDSLFTTGDHRIRFDVALTANVRDRRRLTRING